MNWRQLRCEYSRPSRRKCVLPLPQLQSACRCGPPLSSPRHPLMSGLTHDIGTFEAEGTLHRRLGHAPPTEGGWLPRAANSAFLEHIAPRARPRRGDGCCRGHAFRAHTRVDADCSAPRDARTPSGYDSPAPPIDLASKRRRVGPGHGQWTHHWPHAYDCTVNSWRRPPQHGSDNLPTRGVVRMVGCMGELSVRGAWNATSG
jgi:hypothetical protein